MSAPARPAASICAASGIRWRWRRSSRTCRSPIRILGEDLVIFRDKRGERRPAAPALRAPRRVARVRHHRRARHPLLLSRLALRRRRHDPRDAGRARTADPPQDLPGRLPGEGVQGPDLRLYGPAGRHPGVSALRHLRHPGPRPRAVLDPLALQLAAGERERDGPDPQRLPARPRQWRAVPGPGAFRRAAGRRLPQDPDRLHLQPCAAQGRPRHDPLPRPLHAEHGAERRHVSDPRQADGLRPHRA